MACDIFKTYNTGIPEGRRSNDHKIHAYVNSEQWFDDWPRQLMAGGMTCQEARDYISANWQQIEVFDEVLGELVMIPRIIAQADSFLSLCGALNYNAGSGGTWVQFDLELLNPVTIGGQNEPGVCTPSISTPVDGTWGLIRYDSFVGSTSTWLPDVFKINTVDVNKWFCCRTECCGTGIPIGGGSAFLIPGADMPSPVQENSSTPLIKTPVYLSNHTWAFRNNFGRLPK